MKTGIPIKIIFTLIVVLICNIVSSQPHPYQANVYKKGNTGFYFLYTFKMQKDVVLKNLCQMILDGNGHCIYYNLINKGSDFKLQRNGLISYMAEDSSFHILDKNLKWIDTIRCAEGIETDPHDLQILPNKHYLIIGLEKVIMDLSAYRFIAKSDAPGNKRAQVISSVIQELDENKKLVFEWHAKDHFQFNDVDPFFIKDTAFLDWNHVNSVEQDKDGNLIICVRNFNEITKINRKEGTVMWRFGGRRNQFKVLNDTIPFLGQHDARILANGNLTIYDNGFGDTKRKHFTRALEYKLDEEKKTATLVWSYIRKPGTICERTGNFQRLANGNSLVNFGQAKNENITFEVVDSLGEKVFDLKFRDTIGTYRAFYFPSIPVKFKRLQIKQFRVGNTIYLDAGKGHSSYIWSTGDTMQIIKVLKPGKYFAYVPYQKGSFVSSEIYQVYAITPGSKKSKMNGKFGVH